MWEVILGSVITIGIAHLYYRRSTRDLRKEIDNLKEELVKVKSMSQEIQLAADYILEYATVIKKHVVFGSPDDPNYPYK